MFPGSQSLPRRLRFFVPSPQRSVEPSRLVLGTTGFLFAPILTTVLANQSIFFANHFKNSGLIIPSKPFQLHVLKLNLQISILFFFHKGKHLSYASIKIINLF